MEVNLVTIEQVKENIELLIVKQYIPFAFKKKMVEDIIETCTSTNESGFYIDSLFKQMAFEYSIVNQYSNIELSDNNIIETYDTIKEFGIVNHVFKSVEIEEIKFIEKCLNEQLEYLLKINNSIESVIAKGISKIVEKIPNSKEINKMIPKLTKELSKISPETMEIIKGFNKTI